MPFVLLLGAAFVVGLVIAARSARVSVGATGARASASDVAIDTVEQTFSSLDDLYRKYGAQFGVDWRLVKAIAQHESGENPDAVNSADNESIGLMQVLCRPDGQGGCKTKLNVDGWSATTREKLLDPDWNVFIGAQILATNIEAYGVAKGIAVYNDWKMHNAPAAGPFANQAYVNDVLAKAAALGWSA